MMGDPKNSATMAPISASVVQILRPLNANGIAAGSDGTLVPADYERTVSTLLASESDPVITMEPDGAWTHMITDQALQ